MGRLNYPLEQEWEKLGYSVPMGSSKLLPPPMPAFIRVYHMTNADHAMSDISLHRLKLARVADLNDPFELMALNFRNPRTRSVVAKWRQDYGDSNGLLSFSSDWMNPVLWSHYADQHRGICLGFNLLRDHAIPVKYEAQRLADQLDHDAPAVIRPDMASQLLETKFEHWQYEAEWRCFFPLSDAVSQESLYFVPFSPSLELAEVILGERCSYDVSMIRNLTNTHYRGVNVIKARLEHKGFHLVPDEKSW
jgi:hypothetical protein